MQYHNGQWWYYTPQNQWMYYNNNSWANYDPNSYITPANSYYVGRGLFGRRYVTGYRGIYGPPSTPYSNGTPAGNYGSNLGTNVAARGQRCGGSEYRRGNWRGDRQRHWRGQCREPGDCHPRQCRGPRKCAAGQHGPSRRDRAGRQAWCAAGRAATGPRAALREARQSMLKNSTISARERRHDAIGCLRAAVSVLLFSDFRGNFGPSFPRL